MNLTVNSWIGTRLGHASEASAGMAEAPNTHDGNINGLVSLVCHDSLYYRLHSSLISRDSSITRHGVEQFRNFLFLGWNQSPMVSRRE